MHSWHLMEKEVYLKHVVIFLVFRLKMVISLILLNPQVAGKYSRYGLRMEKTSFTGVMKAENMNYILSRQTVQVKLKNSPTWAVDSDTGHSGHIIARKLHSLMRNKLFQYL